MRDAWCRAMITYEDAITRLRPGDFAFLREADLLPEPADFQCVRRLDHPGAHEVILHLALPPVRWWSDEPGS